MTTMRSPLEVAAEIFPQLSSSTDFYVEPRFQAAKILSDALESWGLAVIQIILTRMMEGHEPRVDRHSWAEIKQELLTKHSEEEKLQQPLLELSRLSSSHNLIVIPKDDLLEVLLRWTMEFGRFAFPTESRASGFGGLTLH